MLFSCKALGLFSKKQYAPNADMRFIMKSPTERCLECTIWAVFLSRSLLLCPLKSFGSLFILFVTIWLTPKWYEKKLRLPNFLKGYFYPELGYTNMNYYGIMWFASPFFYKSDNAQPEDDTAQLLSETAQLLSETGQPVNSKDGLFHLFNKYIKDFSNIPSGGIACAHASDSWGVASTDT